jgi:hypothetical protein
MNYLYSRFAYFLFLIFLSLSTAYAQEYEGRVVGIADGDTLVLLTPEKRQIKVRLAEIGLWGATEQKTDLSFTKAVQTVRYVPVSGILSARPQAVIVVSCSSVLLINQ